MIIWENNVPIILDDDDGEISGVIGITSFNLSYSFRNSSILFSTASEEVELPLFSAV